MYHTHVLGTTRSGKSKYLEWELREKIKSSEGFFMGEKKGPLAWGLIGYCAYTLPPRPIMYLDFRRQDFLIPCNDFYQGDPDRGLQSLLKVWGQEDSSATPTLE